MGVLDLLFPVLCISCKKTGKYICNNCLSKVKVLNNFDPVSGIFSIFNYEGVVRKAIIKIKYNFAFDITSELAEISAAAIRNSKLEIKNCILLPIPLHKKRASWRGFNQSEILGKLIADKLHWEFNKDLLTRPIEGKNQVGLPQSDRVRNIRGKFAVKSKAKLDQNITYIVFDDVVTTGSTIKEGIKVLKNEEALKVFGLTIAR